MNALSRTAAADRAASRTSHARSALIAKLSAWRSASRHLLSFNSTAVTCAGTGRQAPVDLTVPVCTSTRPSSASGPRVERVRAVALVPSRAARVEIRTGRSLRSRCKTLTRSGDVIGPTPLSNRWLSASVSNRTATTSATPCAAGTSPTTTWAPPGGISRAIWAATIAVISASQRKPARPWSETVVFAGAPELASTVSCAIREAISAKLAPYLWVAPSSVAAARFEVSRHRRPGLDSDGQHAHVPAHPQFCEDQRPAGVRVAVARFGE